jgi:CubicO group peptidase (beta-lactamase class C family)
MTPTLSRLVASAWLLCATAVAHADGVALPAPEAVYAGMDRLFAHTGTENRPGCVVGVQFGTAAPLLRTYGVTSLEAPAAIDVDTVFESGSVAKQFTAAALVLLAEDGKLTLDDEVRRWLPELSPKLPPVTIRQLLTHQSGWRDWGDLVELAGWPRGTRVTTMGDILALLARQEALNFVPGSEYSYSNSNYVLAAIIVERASGMSLQRYTRQAIFAPLGMEHTRWREDFSAVVPGRAPAWSPDNDGVWHLDMPFENVIGHGGLLTTVPDLLRWQQQFVTPRIGKAGWVATMEAPGVFNNGQANNYALGVANEVIAGVRSVEHSGSTAGYRAHVGRVPTLGVATALLCNDGSLRSDQLGPRLLAMAAGLKADDGPGVVLGAAATDAASLARAGVYRSTRTRQPARVALFANGLTLNGWSSYRANTDGSYTSAAGTRTLRFDGTQAFTVRTSLGDEVRYERAAEWSPTAAELAAIAGRYHAPEVDADWAFVVENGALVLAGHGGRREGLEVQYRDAFMTSDSGWLVTLRRDKRGRITGFDAGGNRSRTVPFTRVAR